MLCMNKCLHVIMDLKTIKLLVITDVRQGVRVLHQWYNN